MGGKELGVMGLFLVHALRIVWKEGLDIAGCIWLIFGFIESYEMN